MRQNAGVGVLGLRLGARLEELAIQSGAETTWWAAVECEGGHAVARPADLDLYAGLMP